MKNTHNETFEQIIDALHLEQATGRSREELVRMINTTSVLMNLSYCIADVIDSLLLDVEGLLRQVKTPADDRDRSYFKELKKLIGASRKWAQRATRDIMHSDDVRDFENESDWWRDLILMVEDRTGADEMKTRQLLQWISTMPSQLHLFDHIRTKNFQRLTE